MNRIRQQGIRTNGTTDESVAENCEEYFAGVQSSAAGAFGPLFLSVVIFAVALVAFLATGNPVLTSLSYSFFIQIVSFIIFMLTMVASGSIREVGSGPSDGVPNDGVVRKAATHEVQKVADHNFELWRHYERKEKNRGSLNVAFMSNASFVNSDFSECLVGLGHEVDHCSDSDALLDSIVVSPEAWDMLIFDLDVFADIDDAVCELMDFRLRCASVPVLLVSSKFGVDDFSSERSLLGDASLRLPAGISRVKRGIEATLQNFKRAKALNSRYNHGFDQPGDYKVTGQL